MNRPTTAKEALIAEVLGDMASLVDQIEKLEPLMNTSRKELAQVSNHRVRQVSGFEVRMADLTQKAAELCLTQIGQRASGVCTKTLDSQIVAMQSAAREMFNKEFHPVVNRVVSQLEHLTRLAEPNQNPWMPWLTHGAAFVTGAALTWLVVVLVWVR